MALWRPHRSRLIFGRTSTTRVASAPLVSACLYRMRSTRLRFRTSSHPAGLLTTLLFSRYRAPHLRARDLPPPFVSVHWKLLYGPLKSPPTTTSSLAVCGDNAA